MAQVRIEVDRGNGWQVRQEGELAISAADLAAALPGYTIQYPHRAFIGGALIASSERKRNGRVIVTRHDG